MNKIWIGLIHVLPIEGNNILQGARGAYVNVLALAECKDNYINAVTYSSKNLGLIVDLFNDIELFETRQEKSYVNQELIELANSLSTENPIVFDEFQGYFEE